MKWTRESIIDILENHDIEFNALNRQVKIMYDELESDLENTRHKVYPGAVSYDRDRVQKTPTPTDDKLVNVVIKCDEIRKTYQHDIGLIQERMNDICLVFSAIQTLKSSEKSILLNLYYPRKPLSLVSVEMGIDRRTARRLREYAIKSLKIILENWKN